MILLNPPSAARPNSFGALAVGRDNNFGILRTILAILVIYAHSYQVLVGMSDPVALYFHRQRSAGGMAVDFFFIISGYLITASWIASRSARSYARKRVARIYPGLFASLALCVFIVGPLATSLPLKSYFSSISTYRFFEPLLLRPGRSLPGVFNALPEAGVVNTCLWTIPWEIICYIMVAIAGLLGLAPRKLFALSMLALCLVLLHFPTTTQITLRGFGTLSHFPRLFGAFFAGWSFYLLRDRIPCSPWLALLSAAVVLACRTHGLSYVLPLAGCYLIFFLAYYPKLKFHAFDRFGDPSYGLYLYGFPIEQLIVYFVGPKLDPRVHFLLSLLATVPVAYLSWHLLEKRFVHRRRVDAIRTPSPATVHDRAPVPAV